METMDVVWSVDDDEEMSEAVGLMLKLLGYKTRSFSDARSAAKALLGGERPALLLLDVNMPDVSGLELLEFVRSRPVLNDLPVLMLSANATDTDVDLALKHGANGYLIKPISFEELQAGIQAAFVSIKKGDKPLSS
jgi:DNA-binding response OmpR family regulator